MNLYTLIKLLSEARVKLSLENGTLRVNAPKGAVGPELLLELKAKKAELVEYLQARPRNGAQIIPVARQGDLALSFGQQRLWLLDQIDGGSAHYNMPFALALTGRLDIAALERAFASIVLRHESLRTTFAAGDDGMARQVIGHAAGFDVALTDLSALPAGERQLQLSLRMADEAGRVFDLARDPMLRAQLLKLGEEEHALLVTMHHIASDGWSMAILVNEFGALYSAYAEGRADPLPALPVQYADYAHWQRQWLQGEVLASQLGYWRTQLVDLPVVHGLPLDHARPQQQSFAGASVHSRIDGAALAALQARCQASGATLFMGLHALFAVLLSRYSNERDIVIGSPIANREQAEVAGLIGFFVNTLVLRSDLSGQPGLTALLEQSKRTLLDAYAHQQVPFEQIVEALQPERSMRHGPLFQIMLVLQNNEEGALDLPGLSLRGIEAEGTLAKYDLTLNVTQDAQGLELGPSLWPLGRLADLCAPRPPAR